MGASHLDLTSSTLLQKVSAYDSAAWERFVDLYGPLIHHWCRKWAASEDTDDIFQEVMLAVAKNIPLFRRKKNIPGTFRGWLRTITHSKVIDHYRMRRREPAGKGGADGAKLLVALAAQDHFDDPDAICALVHRALDSIRSDFADATWQAFWLVTFDGWSASEVAAKLDKTPAAVRHDAWRVRLRLREELGDEMPT